MKKFISVILCCAMGAGLVPAFPAAQSQQTRQVNILDNPGFESCDAELFPTGWYSAGQNMLSGGDFESGVNAGTAPSGATLKWSGFGGVSQTGFVDALPVDQAEHGNKMIEATWTASQWGGVGYSSSGELSMLNLAYDANYIFKADVYAPSPAQFSAANFRAYYMMYRSPTDKLEPTFTDAGFRVGSSWSTYTTTVTTHAALTDADAYEKPLITRFQFRYASGPVLDGNGRAALYVDNLRLEKQSRTDTAEYNTGDKSLKLVGYDDGLADEFLSAKKPVLGLNDISFGVSAKAVQASSVSYMELLFTDPAGNEVGRERLALTDISNAWRDFSAQAVVPADAAYVQAVLGMEDGTGTVWFDDCTVATSQERKNLLVNHGFEQQDDYDFPTGWTSEGQNLLPNGDFEDGSTAMGNSYDGAIGMKWEPLGGTVLSVEPNTTEDAERFGGYYARVSWNNNQWGGVGVREDAGCFPLSYGSEYIYRASYRGMGEFPSGVNTQFNTIFYTSAGISVEKVEKLGQPPSGSWQDISFTYPIRARTEGDVYDSPLLTRWQFRMSTGTADISQLYVDNLRMEKLGRCDGTEFHGGTSSLKIVGYADGGQDVWHSTPITGIKKGTRLAFGSYAKTDSKAENAQLSLAFYNQQGVLLSRESIAIGAGVSQWQTFSGAGKAPENTAYAVLEPAIAGGGGTAWFDDCYVYAEENFSIASLEYEKWFRDNYQTMLKKDNHINMSVAARYYRHFGDTAYLTDAKGYYDAMIAQWQEDSSLIRTLGNDFFSGNYVIEAYGVLREEGLTTAAEEALILSYLDWFFRADLTGSHNQVIARAVAIAYAVKLFPDAPKADDWRQWLDNYWQKELDSVGDIMEDAGDYNAVAMRDLIRWQVAAGTAENLADARWKAMFTRYKNQLSVNGSMPQYGDDFYGRTLDWIYIFEWCATFYNDQSFAYAARKAFDWGHKNAVNGYHMTSETLELLGSLYPDQVQAAPCGSEITTRRLPEDDQARNKILLRNSDGYTWIDNTYSLSHAHHSAKGAITHYEYEGTPLWHSFTRRYIDVRFQNRLALIPPHEEYPFNGTLGNAVNPGRSATGIWYHDQLELSGLPQSSMENENLRQIDTLCLRLSREKSPQVNLIIDNIRLEGPAGAYVIYDFEDGKTGGFSGSNYTNVADGYNSQKAMMVKLSEAVSGVFHNAALGLEFDITQYDTLKWDWKTTTDAGDTMTWLWFVMRAIDTDFNANSPHDGVDSGYGDCYVEVQPGEYNDKKSYIADAMIQDRNGDSYSYVEMANYMGTGSTVKRRLVMTREGYLIIQDTLYPTQQAAGYRAGPIWNMYNVVESGDNWFLQQGEKKWYTSSADTKGKTNGVFVLFSADENTRVDSVSVAEGAYTQSASRVVTGQPETFITVVAPNLDDVKTGSQLAEGVCIVRDTVYDSAVSYQTASGRVHVQLCEDGAFTVERGNEYVYPPDIAFADGMATVTATAFGDIFPVLAVYDDRRLVRASIGQQTAGNAGSRHITLAAPCDTSAGEYIKLFFWKNNGSMQPLTHNADDIMPTQ